MSRRLPGLWLTALFSILAGALVSLVSFSTAYADSKPYFRVLEGDVFAGGWFKNETDDNYCRDNYQGPTYPISGNSQYSGAIMGFAQVNGASRTGASSLMGAFATGLIEGAANPSPMDYGFYTGLVPGSPNPPGTRGLSFANVDEFSLGDAFWGGTFEGQNSNAHCIPDYYNTNVGSATGGWPGPAGFASGGQFTWDGGNLTNDVDRTLLPGVKLTLFVNGDVRIDSNITYAPSDISNIPKFKLVVQGNIYIDPSVTRLDGWYIAQPNGVNDGVIWTCHDGSDPTDSFIRQNCDSKLVINGALTAKQVNLSRIAGGLGGDSAEDINYSPQMVLGGPFLEDDTPGTAGAIQSLISLPPVF